MVQSQKISPVAGTINCSYLTTSLTRELPCLVQPKTTGQRDPAKAFASICDCSQEQPVGLAEASAPSSLGVCSLCPIPVLFFSSQVYLLRAVPRNLLYAILYLGLFPGNCSFIPVTTLKEKCTNSSCYQHPLELLLLSFSHPVLLPFRFPIFSQELTLFKRCFLWLVVKNQY